MLATLRPTLQATPARLTRALASHAYAPPAPRGPPGPPGNAAAGPSTPAPGTTTSPDLAPADRRLLEEIVRVDHAGELGANWIYRGQKWACQLRGDRETASQVEGMWDNERHHLNTLTRVAAQHAVRPTALYPAWQVLAWGLGAGTALLGKEAAMACTEAVETVIGEHYDDQLRALAPVLRANSEKAEPDASLPLLAEILEEFRDDELAHLDTAVEEGALRAPAHALLSAAVGAACHIGIAVAKRV
ncbi:ubiquinone biosynthesis monooxygenase Coq7 [Vanrija albida]|uniref:5-demethoxyubiquinone hydroxylase, mitochondrial n=1 Tax=Vanrija albida TaxID=181172 RepID=A0ABR3QE86_9TREE